MVRGEPQIILTIDTKSPVKVDAFVGAFTALENEYDRFIKQSHPGLQEDAELYVSKVRSGSFVVEMLPMVTSAAPLIIADMERVLIVEQFVRLWGKRFKALLSSRPTKQTPETKSELNDWMSGIQAIAQDSNGSAKLEAAVFEDGQRKIRAAVKFSTPDARKASLNIVHRLREIEKKEYVDHARVLMRFTRSDVGDVNLNKPSGERVVVDEISSRALALIYASDLAEQRIKHEIRVADDNVYKKGFVVDVNVRSTGGGPAAYAVTNVHQVIDLPDEEVSRKSRTKRRKS